LTDVFAEDFAVVSATHFFNFFTRDEVVVFDSALFYLFVAIAPVTQGITMPKCLKTCKPVAVV
jgi:hypothetical protein